MAASQKVNEQSIDRGDSTSTLHTARPPVRKTGGSDSAKDRQPAAEARDDTVSDSQRGTDKVVVARSPQPVPAKETSPAAKRRIPTDGEALPVVELADDEVSGIGDNGTVDLGIEVFGGSSRKTIQPTASLLQQRRERTGRVASAGIPMWVWGAVAGVVLLVVVVVALILSSGNSADPNKKIKPKDGFRESTAGVDFNTQAAISSNVARRNL